MNVAKRFFMAVSLLLLVVGLADADWAAAEGGRRSAEREAEAGGWQVAYGNQLTERDVAQGEVQPGVSIFSARGTREMGVLHEWANALVQQAAVGQLEQEERFQAMRFTVRTIRELIRNRQPGAQQMELNTVEIKAGLLQYHDRDRSGWGHNRGERSAEMVFVPYVGMRAKAGSSPWSGNNGPTQQAYQPQVAQNQNPYQQDPPSGWHGASSAEIMNAFSLKNTSRNVGGGRWQWTAYIDGPSQYLDRIRSVSYYLHPSFKPSVQQGDSARPGHPLTATGWGVFVIRAEVSLDDGTRRIYEHMLRFK